MRGRRVGSQSPYSVSSHNPYDSHKPSLICTHPTVCQFLGTRQDSVKSLRSSYTGLYPQSKGQAAPCAAEALTSANPQPPNPPPHARWSLEGPAAIPGKGGDGHSAATIHPHCEPESLTPKIQPRWKVEGPTGGEGHAAILGKGGDGHSAATCAQPTLFARTEENPNFSTCGYGTSEFPTTSEFPHLPTYPHNPSTRWKVEGPTGGEGQAATCAQPVSEWGDSQPHPLNSQP